LSFAPGALLDLPSQRLRVGSFKRLQGAADEFLDALADQVERNLHDLPGLELSQTLARCHRPRLGAVLEPLEACGAPHIRGRPTARTVAYPVAFHALLLVVGCLRPSTEDHTGVGMGTVEGRVGPRRE